MQDFEYFAAKSVEEVIARLSSSSQAVRILSGGTDLLVQLREGRKTAQVVVDIKRIPELNELVFDPDQGLIIGAAVPCFRICADGLVNRIYPGLVDAIRLIGGVQIQGRATVGGNLCNASPAADSIPALIVHRAVCQIAGPGGMREVPVEDFLIAPGKNILEPGELLVSVRVPHPSARFGARYLRFIPRNEMDIAVVGVGAAVVLDEEKTKFVSARIALGAVGPTPLLALEAGDGLAGKTVAPENIQWAAEQAQTAAQPITDMRGSAEQRRHLTLVLTRRALMGAVERARSAGTNGGNGHHS